MANASCNTATLVSNLLTVSGAVSGTILVGMTITAAGVPPGVTISSYGTGAGQAGTYNCSASAANVTIQEPMVFSLSWNMPLQGNSGYPQLVDPWMAAGAAFIFAMAIPGPSAGPGQEYYFGTHQAAIYNSIASGSSQVFPAVPGSQGQPVANYFTNPPQYAEPIPSTIYKDGPLLRTAKYQSLQMIYAAPQLYDPTPTQRPVINTVYVPQTSFGFGAEYQFGTHQKALYDSQNSSIVWNAIPTGPGAAPLKFITVYPQDVSGDPGIFGSSRFIPLAEGWINTMITAGPQSWDFTLEAVITPSQPLGTVGPAQPLNPPFFFAQPQFDITQIPARVIKPPNKPSPQFVIQTLIGGPTPQEQAAQQQIQPQILYTSLPGPSKKIQPVTIWVYEQQYDRTNYPQLIIQAVPPFIPPPPIPAPVIPAPTISEWTTDATQVTADTINFTADGSNLIAGGGLPTSPAPPESSGGGNPGPARDVSQNLRF